MFTLADIMWEPCIAGVNEMGGFELLGNDEALDLGNGKVVQGPGTVSVWRWYKTGNVVAEVRQPDGMVWRPS